jgi:hypothetical protein
MDNAVKSDVKPENTIVKTDKKTDEKVVRPKRKYIKKKDRLNGIVIKNEPVIIRFD